MGASLSAAAAATYCLPWVEVCRTMGDWKDLTTIVATIFGLPAVIFTALKALKDFEKARLQREEEARQREEQLRLRRTEFTLAQHRRLHDDPTIASVLVLLEQNSPELAKPHMWQAKIKFLTFIEELCLLTKAGYVQEEVAVYMFGYFAHRAYLGKNFGHDVKWDRRSWGLFMDFAEKSTMAVNAQNVDLTRMTL